MPSVAVSTTLKCILPTATNGVGAPCLASPTHDNVIQVVQTAVVPTFFIRALAAFGINSASSITLTAESTAALDGSANKQYNVAIVLDSTGSMSSRDTDASCNSNRITCALNGVQAMLTSLSPCTFSSAKVKCAAVYDNVSLFTYPEVQANTAKYDTTCAAGNPKIVPYTTPSVGATWASTDFTSTAATYQLTGYLADYSADNQANGGLNTSSALSVATGAGGCAGIAALGGEDTYYAGAIYAAQSSLAADKLVYPNAQNAIVILSDGDANSANITVSGTVHAAGTSGFSVAYPSKTDECQQAIDAANYATSQGTTVYVIAYGASNSGCSTDTSGPLKGLSACTALQDMATTPADFYSDATASQNKGQCTSSANPSLTLSQIFQAIQVSFTTPRLLPNSVAN